jgi:hypothetical protein
MRAVLALLAVILVFLLLNIDRVLTIDWWKRRETAHRRHTRRLEVAPQNPATALPPSPSSGVSEAPSLAPEQHWRPDGEWPEEWTEPSTPRSSARNDKPTNESALKK